MELIDNKIYFIVKEYEKLKEEQNKRIEFRDNMIYITLGVIGSVFSFILEKPDLKIALLVLPFVCIVLGWTYLMNDEKTSEIGSYLKDILIPKIEKSKSDASLNVIPNWEDYHRNTSNRTKNKIIQLIIDLALFSISALFSIFLFLYLSGDKSCFQIILAGAEVVLIIFLAFQFILASRINK